MTTTAQPSLAFYGDSIGAEVYAINVDYMALAARIPTVRNRVGDRVGVEI